MTSVPSLIDRPRLERFGRMLAELKRRKARKEQSQRGWYDNNGVRQGGLIAFIRYFWHVLEPANPFVDGWNLWAMAEHLEAVTYGEINRLLINISPGSAKSLVVNVFFPAFEWGPMQKAHYRYLSFSYSATLTERDNDRFRTLINSKEYQALYGPIGAKVSPVELRNKTTVNVQNTKTGWKLASSVGGVGTGARGNRVLIDDPHNVIEAESDIVRAEAIRWFRESISNRFNDPTGALIIIMQRVHQDDVSKTALDLGYCNLCIPWEYDTDRSLDDDGQPIPNAIGWIDPRTEDGEPAWPERFPAETIARIKEELGPYAWAAQYQQLPAPRGGGLFKRDWWQVWDSPNGKYPVFDRIVASLDCAVTEKEENNPSGFTIWGTFQVDERNPDKFGVMLIDGFRRRLEMHGKLQTKFDYEVTDDDIDSFQTKIAKEQAWKNRVSKEWGLIEWVAYLCRFRRVDTLLIESEKGGIIAAQEMQRLYGDEPWGVILRPVKGDKYARAQSVVPMFSQGLVYAPVRDWSEMVIDEMEVFPRGKFDDLTDSTTQALRYLRDVGLARTERELQAEEKERMRYDYKRHRQKAALYPTMRA